MINQLHKVVCFLPKLQLTSYSTIKTAQKEITDFIPTLLYFSYTFLIVFSFWLLTGTIGFYASYLFIKTIYSQIKIDQSKVTTKRLTVYISFLVYFIAFHSKTQVTQGLEICCSNFSKISHFLERILMEHIEQIFRLGSKLFFISMCSIRIRFRQ